MAPSDLHSSVRNWFDASFAQPTPVQQAAWAAIRGGRNVLIAAPTGSGKTLAAFLCAIDDLVRQSRRQPLADGVQVLYVSPLKALSNDIERNLRVPLEGIDERLAEEGGAPSGIRTMVRTGDTTPGEREQMRRRPPQILVTTPESLYLLLTSDSGRGILASVQTVIVDEIHAVAGSKRGSHLALSLARLDALTRERSGCEARRIGLSATQKPITRIAEFLAGGRECEIVDTGHQRERDLALELPRSPLTPVMAAEVWEEIYDRLETLVLEHRTTLVFVNTRRLAERLARHLAERLGEDAVTAHHGSLSRDHRLQAEQALKSGHLRALVATASLELGIDIGHVDLVCQLGSPGSISAFIQRVGRAGHAVGEVPKGRLFPLSRDDLVESVALLQAVREGVLDAVHVPAAPLDVLSQQLVAEVSAREWSCDALYSLVTEAWPYRGLSRGDFDEVVAMLAGGFATRRGRRAAFLHLDAVNGRVRARPSARLVALQNGGAIPDHFDYEVVMLPQGFRVGTLNEDFAFESIPGDIFQLGNTAYRILKIEQGRVLVEDAHGQPPTIPFWFGDAPGRSDELSAAVSDLRREIERLLSDGGREAVLAWLATLGIDPVAALQVADYLAAAHDALGCLPTAERAVLERFFDETGDMHLVVHAPLGSRIMRAWGLALRKRFCRQFNFELGSAALPEAGDSPPRADSGPAGRADVRGALALECDHRAGRATHAQRPEAAAAVAAQPGRGPRRGGVPGPAGLFRKHPGRAGNPGSPAGAPDHWRLSHRHDGRGWAGGAAYAHRDGCAGHSLCRPERALAAGGRDHQRASVCLPGRRRRREPAHAGHPAGAGRSRGRRDAQYPDGRRAGAGPLGGLDHATQPRRTA